MNWFFTFLVLILIVGIVIYVICTAISFGDRSGGAMGGRGLPTIFVQDPWFDDMSSGKKKVEVRVGSIDKFSNLVRGRKFKIVAGPGKKLRANVVAMREYKDLASMFKKEGWKEVAPHTSSEKAAKDALMMLKNKAGETIFDDDRIKEKGGLTVIEFTILKN